MYRGTRAMRDCASERCSAPKTARGMAKHRLLKEAILSRPRALAMSSLAAHRPINRRAMPAEHMATATGIWKNVARRAGRIGLPICLQRLGFYNETELGYAVVRPPA